MRSVALFVLLCAAVFPSTARQVSRAPSNAASDWKQATDPNSGRVYYWHTKTRQTTWIRPAEFDAAPAAPSPAASKQSSQKTATQSSVASTLPSAATASAAASEAGQATLDEAAAQSTVADQQMPLHARAASVAGGVRSRLASAAGLGGHDDERSDKSGSSPAKALLKGLQLGGVVVAAAAVL